MPIAIVCIAFLAFASATAAADTSTPEQFVLKQSDPHVGTNIKKSVVQSTQLPLNKRYAELTSKEQAILKAQYEKMPEGDEPPYPARGLAPIFKSISEGQQKLLVEGPLSIDVEVAADGTPSKVYVHQSPSPEMTRFVAAILMFEQYKPGLCSGMPCRMAFPFRMQFRIAR